MLLPMVRGPLLVFALFIALELGCSDSLGFDPIIACSDSQAVTVHTSLADGPRFTWEPSCGMASLQVFADSGGSGSWIVYSGSAAADNPLPSGVRYGQLPPNGVAPGGAQPLTRGLAYRVSVYRWVGQAGGPGSLFERGSATFTP
jgi:hypothetical protein